MPFIQICLLLFLFHIKYGNNIQDIPNVSYTDTSTYVQLKIFNVIFFFLIEY
jgi:hypothetical protein